MKKDISFIILLLLLHSFVIFCQGNDLSNDIKIRESQEHTSSGESLEDLSQSNGNNLSEDDSLQNSYDEEKTKSPSPTTTTKVAGQTTSTTVVSTTTTKIEGSKTSTITIQDKSTTTNEEKSTTTGTSKGTTEKPCPSCDTSFALGTFFFGNFFGMSLMLIMGYIYLVWLRRTTTSPSSARLY
uniref:LITAF domain-containing protein n=1 Tax=Parastrongyloides trichosuri TaxID=131310 RepID=A0A0N4ZEH8_PARTI